MNTVPQPEDLRQEYMACERHVGVLNTAGFQSAAIVLGGSIAGIAVLVDAEATWLMALAVTVLAGGAVLIIWLWRFNWTRNRLAVLNHWRRMRQIEWARGMRKNIFLSLLVKEEGERSKQPEWAALSPEERVLLGETYDSVAISLTVPVIGTIAANGQDVLHSTALLVQIGWFLLAVLKWVQVAT